jgi:hypothetical protein
MLCGKSLLIGHQNISASEKLETLVWMAVFWVLTFPEYHNQEDRNAHLHSLEYLRSQMAELTEINIIMQQQQRRILEFRGFLRN